MSQHPSYLFKTSHPTRYGRFILNHAQHPMTRIGTDAKPRTVLHNVVLSTFLAADVQRRLPSLSAAAVILGVLLVLATPASATSWDWSGGDGALVVTDATKPTKSGTTNPGSSSLLVWNGNGFEAREAGILTAPNTDTVAPLPDAAQRAIATQSDETAIDPALLMAVITSESSGNPNAVSHAGAEGLMQLMPATAERFGVTDSFDPEQNIRGGAAYLKFLLDRYDGDVWRAAAAYNAGEGRIDRGVIPAESRDFANRVVALWINQRMGRTK